MSTQYQQFDICIIGAGMVGAACACAFAQLGLRVAVVESYLPAPFEASQSPDLRVSALNRHSINLLTDLNAYDAIEVMRYRVYDTLSVWEDELAKTTFSAHDINEKQLGIFAENRIIQLALLQSIKQHHNDSVVVFNTKAKQIDTASGTLELANCEYIQAKLIVGADGANSQVRLSAGIGQTGWDYRQRANLILIRLHEEIADETWQQFTPTGPLALLPMHDNYASLVWYASAEKSALIQAMDNDDLQKAVIKKFPARLGNFEVCDKAGFGLRRMHANQYWQNKAVLVGDAAHTINPLAGQGVNLGFKDVSALINAIKEHGLDDLSTTLAVYQKQRKLQNLLMMSTMDALYASFSNDIQGIKLLRNFALGMAQRAGPLKNMALKYAMGI
ncbi:FAD-dependent oxidoreductase [Glaciecola sp. SC05]|uniref:FAD-dependent oxidoreductase n=1 Tax=Glaciecola sp. SC05 TaxID=1987355 RepID=UPI003528FB30